ncbi:MAG: hypothetical protein ABI806_26235 [Candidatus Solibacter sp.]
MARHPEWFERLDAIQEVLRRAEGEWLGRKEIKAIFGCSERDSIRLLHKFGAEERDNALSLPQAALRVQLEAIQAGSTYAAFLRQRQGVARHLAVAREENAARQFRVNSVAEPRPRRFQDLPETVTLQRAVPEGLGRFEIRYADGADLMRQLASFLAVSGANREEFFAATEPSDASAR